MQNGWICPRRLAGGTLGALVAALAVAGCSQNNPPATPPTSNTVVTTNPAPASSTTTVATPGGTTTTAANPNGPDTKINTNAGPGTSNGTDTGTADAINAAIVHNKQMTGSRVEVVVTGGVARLNGTVQDQQQKALAATTASKTPGVSSVINKLEIVATGGAHGTPATPKTVVKVYKKTVVVHDHAAPPAGTTPSGSGQDNTGDNGSSGTDNGSGGGAGDNGTNGSGDNNGTSDNSGNGGGNSNP